MAEVLLHELVPQTLGSITPGEDNTARVNAAIWKMAPGDKAKVRGTITVDGTLGSGKVDMKDGKTPVELKDLVGRCVQAEKGGDGFQWLTNRGPDLNYTAQNNRAHWRWVNPDNCWTCGLTITGTHPMDGPNRSPDEGTERDIWEGQAGIHISGGRNSGAVGCHIKQVWGDGLAVAAYSYNNRAQTMKVGTGHTFLNCSLDRNGRVALLMNGASDFTCDGFVAKNFVSSYYHIEVATNPNMKQTNLHLIRGKQYGGGSLAHFTSGAGVEDVFIEDNECIDKAFACHFSTKLGLGFKRFTIARNLWQKTSTADELITAWNVDGMSLANNVGYRDARCKVFDAAGLATCRNVTQTGNKFTIV